MTKFPRFTLTGLFIDLLIFGGMAMLFYGLHQAYPPAAYVVVGAALIFLGLRFNK